jgi:hypothetical protein
MTPIFCGGLLALLGIIAALYVLGVFSAKWQDETQDGEERYE